MSAATNTLLAEARAKEAEVVRIGLLGSFSVWVGERKFDESAWRLRKAASLIKLLALAPGHRLHRERAMGLLWPESSKKAASNNLRQTLHVARKTLHADPEIASGYLSVSGEQLLLCPKGQLWVDVEAFEQAAETARRSKDPAAYRAAIELYSGELLPEDRYEEWAESRRQELRQTFLSLLVELARLYEERGSEEDLTAAVQALQRVLTEESTNEEAHVGLMRLYALSGSQGEALRQYGRLSEALSSDLDGEPSASARALREEIAAGRFPGDPTESTAPPTEETSEGARAHNLPAQRTSFVGREREMLELKRQLAMTRLLTLIGAGGSGKTRLALEVAKDLVGAYPGGVWIVELAPLTEGALVPQAVAKAVKVPEQPGRGLTETLVDALREERLLLVLDNCEHLIEAAARLADALLSSCPHLRVVATSRETLGVEGELVWRVDPLSVPDAPREDDRDAHRAPAAGELERYDAVRLFVERAKLRSPHFELTAENAGAVAHICSHLEGMPLAIELAAARVGTLAVEQISERLRESLKLLKGNRTATPRQRTLRATLEWSYNLLSAEEQVLLPRLSVFAGGWTLEAAEEAVSTSQDGGEDDVLELIFKLVDKSLVVAEVRAGEVRRYRLLELVRQYVREKLEESAEAEVFQRRHAEFFLALAEVAEPELRGPRQGEWLERLELDHDNFRAALSWVLERGEAQLGLRLSGALGEFWHRRGHVEEGRRWLQATLASGDEAPARIRALLHAGFLAWEQLDYERSEAFGEEALALAREQGDSVATANALYIVGAPNLYQLNLDRAAELYEEAAMLQRAMGDATNLARTVQALGLTAIARQDFDRAAELYEESLTLAREAEDQLMIVQTLGLGALAFLGQGDHNRAKELSEEGLKLSGEMAMKHAIVFHLHAAAALASAQGRLVRSARLWGAGEALMREIGTGLGPVESHHYGPYIASARAELEEASWQAAWDEGREMTSEHAVEYALSEEEPGPLSTTRQALAVASEQGGTLTRREEEVAALVARGLSNRQIAQELFLSERTIENHVSKILRKLGLASRTEIAAWVTQQRLLVPNPE